MEAYVAAKRDAGVGLLPVDWSHAAAVESLPLHHRDPFDRLLIAQARADRLPVVTADAVFARYGIEVIW